MIPREGVERKEVASWANDDSGEGYVIPREGVESRGETAQYSKSILKSDPERGS